MTTSSRCACCLPSCTTHKAEPARSAFDSSSRNPDLLSLTCIQTACKPEKEPVVRYGRYTLVSTSLMLVSAT
ncbi:hypothetical protein P4114_00075 [Pseudomonas aeruginosa]|nr:hypothetical protein [Pseudomonas aeruginosa]